MDRTEIVVLLDRSGSMQSIQKDTEGGFNAFIEEQKKVEGPCNVTLVQFNTSGIETVYEGQPVGAVPKLFMHPSGGTPLLDAIGKTIAKTRIRLDKCPACGHEGDMGAKVLFVIITDGEENQSREFKRDHIKTLIEERTRAGWAFVYLGANVDAFGEASSIGISVLRTANYAANEKGVLSAYAGVSQAAVAFRGAVAAGAPVLDAVAFNDAQRDAMMDKQK